MNSPHRNRNENMVMKENIFRPTVEKVLADIQIIIITICNDIYIYFKYPCWHTSISISNCMGVKFFV